MARTCLFLQPNFGYAFFIKNRTKVCPSFGGGDVGNGMVDEATTIS